MIIRHTTLQDLPYIMDLYQHAKVIMAKNGNPHQWNSSYPTSTLIQEDIKHNKSYLCEWEGKIIGTFYYAIGEEKSYDIITNGSWLNTAPYGVIHRIASNGIVSGVGSFCLDWALNQCGNLKLDTHRDNAIMRNLLRKNDFTYCGIIYLEDGDERLAYQKTSPGLCPFYFSP